MLFIHPFTFNIILLFYSKDGLGLTDDSKHKMGSDYESDSELSNSTPLAAQDSTQLHLDDGQLETLALVCQSKAGVKMLFDSGLLRILIESILGTSKIILYILFILNSYLLCIFQFLLISIKPKSSYHHLPILIKQVQQIVSKIIIVMFFFY